jgi:serine/threonine protein kinase
MSITPVAKPISPSCQVDPQVKKRAHTYIRSMPTPEQLHRIYDQVRLRLPEGIRRKEFCTLAMAIASYNRDRRHAFLIPLQSFSDMALVHLGSGSNGHVFRGVCLNDQPSRANRNTRVALQSRLELIERIEAGHQCIAVKFSTDSKNLSMGATRMARVSAAGGPVVHYSWFHKYTIKDVEERRGRESVMCVHTMSMIDGVILESMLVMPPDTKPDLIHILRRMGDGDRRSLKQSFVRTVGRIAAGAVLSLRALHRHVLHRDLKPDNMSASYSPEAIHAIRRGEWGNFIPKVKYFDLDFSEDTEPLRVYTQQTPTRSSSSSRSLDISGAPAYASERVLKYGESDYQFADDLCALCYSMWHIMHSSEFGRIFFDSASDCEGREDYMRWFARVRRRMFKPGSTIRVKHAIPKQILELCRRQYERSFFQIEYLNIAKLWLRAGGWDAMQGFDAWWEQEVVRLDLCTILAGRHIPPTREIRALCTPGSHTHDLTRNILDRIGIVPRHEGIEHEFVTLKQSQRYRSKRLYRRYDSLCAGMVPGLSL